MASAIHLKSPPIVEAVIEIQVNGTKELFQPKIPEIEDAYKKIANDLESQVMDFYHHQIGWQGNQVSASSSISPKKGLQFLKKTSDQKNTVRIITVQPDRFRISWLETYQNWNVFFKEASTFWEEYQKLLKPQTISRIGVRFINRITLKDDIEHDLRRLLVQPLLLNHSESSKFLGYLTKHLFEDDKKKLNIGISQLIEKHGELNTLIIDHDVFHTSTINAEDKAEIQSVFQMIHEVKDKVFWDMVDQKEFEKQFN